MTSKGQSFEMFRGDDKIISVETFDSDNNIEDITNCILRWVWYKRSPHTIVLDKTTTSGGGIEITDPTHGIFEVTLIPEDTENLLGDYNHECELIDINNKTSTIMVGNVKILTSIA